MSNVPTHFPAAERKLEEVRLTLFGVYGQWSYPNEAARDHHDGRLSPDEVLAVVRHVIEKYQLPADHEVCVEYNFAVNNPGMMVASSYGHLLYSITGVTKLVDLTKPLGVAPAAVVPAPVQIH